MPGDGGTVTVQGGTATTSGTPGIVFIRGGTAGSGTGPGGDVEIIASNSGGASGTGGAISITGGNATGSDDGGDITITPGSGAGGGSDGVVSVVGTIEGSNAAAWTLLDEAATASNPTVIPNKADPDTGIGWESADALSLVSGGVEAIRFAEASSAIIQTHESNVGLTADVGSSQGDGVITSTYNVYSTVANAGDAATLPSTFEAGTVIYIKNDGANSMDVFPASGDDAGAGVNTAVAVGAGESKTFIASTTNSTWTQLIQPAGVSGATISGTPANNEVAVWTNSTTIEGDPNFTWDGSTLNVDGTIQTDDAAGPSLVDEAATSTNPTIIPNKTDTDTGVGWNAADALSLVSGGLEAVRYEEASSNVIVTNEIDAAASSSTTQTQGQAPLTSSYNVVNVVANDNDVVTMPSAAEGRIVTIVNRDSDNILQVFPASGDSVGAGTNVSVTMPPQSSRTFIGVSGTTIWATVSEGLEGGGGASTVPIETGKVQTTDATTTELLALSILTGTTVGFELFVMGREDSTGDSVFERIFGAIRRQGGTTSLVGSVSVDRTDDVGASTWTIDVAADDGTDELTVDVTGEAAHTIDWKARLVKLEIQ